MAFSPRVSDYYALLGVSRNASPGQIRRAFAQRAKQLHPDLNTSSDAGQAFLGLSEAYYVLRDPERRRRFDARRYGEMRAGRPPQARRPALQGWAAAFVLVGLIGAATFVLEAADATNPVAENESRQSEHSGTAGSRVAGAAPSPEPLIIAANPDADAPRTNPPKPEPLRQPVEAPAPPEAFQATATPDDIPVVTAPDILAQVPATKNQPRSALVAAPISAAASKPVNRHATAAPSAHHVVFRAMRHMRTHVAQTSRAWTSRKRHRVARHAARRHYATL